MKTDEEKRAARAAYMREWRQRDGDAQQRAKDRQRKYAVEHPGQQAAYKRKWYDSNKAQAVENAKAWKDRNPDYMKDSARDYHQKRKDDGRYWAHHLKQRYGITPEDETAILDAQDYRCAICCCPLDMSNTRKRHIDHDHDTGVVRGILCVPCNHGIGNFRDNPALLDAARAYLLSTVHGYEV